MSNKEKALEKARGFSDNLARGLDQGMIRPVAALILIGIKTTASCEGHGDRALSYPWIALEVGVKERAFLEERLPSFHCVKQGSARYPLSYKLQPREIAEITSPDPGGEWSEHLLELEDFAREILDQSA